VHGRVSGLGRATKLVLSPGQDADISYAGTLLNDAAPAVVIADKGYDKQALVDAIELKGGEAVIPNRSNRIESRDIDKDRYKDRNLVERFWSRMKQYRRMATRYEKTARNFLAFLHVAATMDWLR
jgi:transposase